MKNKTLVYFMGLLFKLISPLIRKTYCLPSILALSSFITLAANAADIKMEQGTLTGVGSDWQTVSLSNTYTDPVVVCTPQYTSSDLPAVTRVRNASGNSFEVRVQNPSDAPLSGYGVSYMVVEAGTYTEAVHGITMEAVKVNSTITDKKNSWTCEQQSYLNSYNAPVVFGQVMTENNVAWSTFWSRGNSKGNPVNRRHLYTGKHVGEGSNTGYVDETLGYIVVESGSGVVNGQSYLVGLGSNTIEGIGNAPPYSYNLASNTWDHAIVTQAAMNSNDGSWAMLYGTDPLTDSILSLAVDEDQVADPERSHGLEQVSYFLTTAPPAPTVFQMEQGTRTGVGSDWQTVSLSNTYTDPVVVCTPQYTSSDLPAVTRVRNASGNSFEVRVQNPSDAPLSGYGVSYMVVEAGTYTEAVHGITMEAVKVNSTITDKKNSWTGEQQSYLNSYNAPVVFGQVMTENNVAWSTFWSSNGTQTGPANSSTFYTGKHVGEGSTSGYLDETLGYIVVESGSGVVNGQSYLVGLGSNTIEGIGNAPPFSYSFASNTWDHALVTQAAMNGSDGSWALLYGTAPLTDSTLSLATDEDQVGDSERGHAAEQVGYFLTTAPPTSATFTEDVSIGSASSPANLDVYGTSTLGPVSLDVVGGDIGSADNPNYSSAPFWLNHDDGNLALDGDQLSSDADPYFTIQNTNANGGIRFHTGGSTVDRLVIEADGTVKLPNPAGDIPMGNFTAQ